MTSFGWTSPAAHPSRAALTVAGKPGRCPRLGYVCVGTWLGGMR